jgi:formylglycine-generating enzyme required for sulfatase activity
MERSPLYPINMVSLKEAIAFTHKLRAHCGKEIVRIPSRAEWERACRAGATTAFATGDVAKSLAGYANVSSKITQHPQAATGAVDWIKAVKSFAPNQWGYFDMHGNVSEYCLGLWESLPAECSDPATSDDLGRQKGSIRGGAYDHDTADNVRCAAMPYLSVDSHTPNVGFRFLIESPH